MILDLHVHSVYSVDSPVRPEEYARRMVELRADYDLSGFVLMEHNYLLKKKECDLYELSREYGLVILAGVEVDTFWGHLLVYGMPKGLWLKIEDSGTRKQEPVKLAREVEAEDGALVPAHPFRGFIGAGVRCKNLPGVRAIETLNGANSEEENDAAIKYAAKEGLAATGGSDAHFLGELGNALTRFSSPIRDMQGLTREIRAGRCQAITLEEAKKK